MRQYTELFSVAWDKSIIQELRDATMLLSSYESNTVMIPICFVIILDEGSRASFRNVVCIK
jgi:hypothetical protein